jgi:cytochrome c-type biogenesis protein CcmH
MLPAVLLAAALTTGPPPPVPEHEAREIETLLVAPCCYTQTVSVHQSPAADEARRDIRARLARGETRDQIVAAYVAQHGKRVLAQPPASGFDLALYVAPLLGLLGSVVLLGVVVRRFTKRRQTGGMGSVREPPTAADRAAEQRLDEELRDLD